MNLDPLERARLAERVRGRLAEAMPGSQADLQGSLAWGGADPYSDIDVLWQVPDESFEWSVNALRSTLSSLYPLESLRLEPSLQLSRKRRRVYARFDGFPLFWQCDLDIYAQSIQRDQAYDVGNPQARGPDRSAGESTLMGAVGALRAHLRGRQKECRELLERSFSRMGMQAPDQDGVRPIVALVEEASRRYADLEGLGTRVLLLIRQTGEARPMLSGAPRG